MKPNYSNLMTCVKQASMMLFVCFISIYSYAQYYPIDSIMRNGNRANRVNLVFVADGYTAAQLPNFVANVTSINTGLFLQPPFAEYKNFFNSFAIQTPSVGSGSKHPQTTADGGCASQPVANPSTFLNSTFDYAGIHRLLVPGSSATVYSTLANNLPDYDQVFVLCNSTYYGGSGGQFATSSVHASATEIAIHEIGHSFAGLADEYWAGPGYAAEKPNLTQNNNPATVKWKNWYGLNGVGIYAHGVSGTEALWFRPHQNCKMRYLNAPFCSVCIEKYIDRIHQLVNMTDSYIPATPAFTLTNTEDVSFSVNRLSTIPNTISVNWYLNGSSTPFATGVDGVTIPFANFIVGVNTVRAEVVDNTALSKSFLPAIGYINNTVWSVTRVSVVPVNLLSFSGTVNARNEGLLNWVIDNTDDLQYFELEKRSEQGSFEKLASVPKQGSSREYAFIDPSLLSPVGYYRLKIVNTDGSVQYSNQLALRNSFEKYSYKVYQDADARQYRLNVNAGEAASIHFLITDAAGKTIMRKDLGRRVGQVNYDIDLSKHAAGIYYMNLRVASGTYNIPLVAK